jgi:hypothetical protein
MVTLRSNLTRRVLAALDASPSRIPVLVGGCGSGRTTLLHQIKERLGRTGALYLDVERSATTPERFLKAVVASSPFPISEPAPASARAAFDTTLGFLSRAKNGSGEPVTILLDEFLELRTFESFPGLRRVLYELVDGLASSGNRFVLTSRYVARTLRLLRDRSSRFEVIHMPAMTTEDTLDVIAQAAGTPGKLTGASLEATQDADYLARTVQALADGRPAYVRALAEELARMRGQGRGGPSPPRARLRRAQGDSRDPRRRRRTDADRNLAPAAADAGVDQGLPVVARGRRSRHRPAEALQLHRPAAARVGPPALPRDRADRRRPRPRSAPLRAAAPAAAAGSPIRARRSDVRDGRVALDRHH